MKEGLLRESADRPWYRDRYIWAIATLIAALVIYKIPYLSLPFYWDEAWVYAPAVRTMHTRGISLLPGSIPQELSRGHPLFFHFTNGLWMKLFGDSRAGLHAFMLLLSALLLIAVYSIGARLGSKLAGAGATLFVAGNEMFLAQSGLLLPEVMVALLIVCAIERYVAKAFTGYFIFASLALLTKESALVVILVLVGWQILRPLALGKHSTPVDSLKGVLLALSPLIPAGTFFLCQRSTTGWFLYPDHVSLMTWDLADVTYKVKLIFSTFFEGQGMLLALYTIAFLAPLIRRPFKPVRAVLTILLYITAIKVLFGRWPMSPSLTLALPVVCFGFLMITEYGPMLKQFHARGEFVIIAFLFTITYWTFSSINFFSDRYLLSLVPIMALGSSLLIFDALRDRHKAVFPTLMLVLCACQFAGIGSDDKVGDTKLAYADAIEVQKAIISHAVDQRLTKAVFYAPFMEKLYMTDDSMGYFPEGVRFTSVEDRVSPGTEYAIINNATTASVMSDLRNEGFSPVFRTAQGKAWGELWQRNYRRVRT